MKIIIYDHIGNSLIVKLLMIISRKLDPYYNGIFTDTDQLSLCEKIEVDR